MSFFKALKQSLGFGPEDEDDNIYDDAEVSETNEDAQITSKNDEGSASTVANVEKIKFEAEIRERIFAKVVEVVNASLPQFFASTLDQEAQRKYLLDALDQGIKDYLEGLSDCAEKYCEARWQQARATMAAELDALRTRASDTEKKSDDFRQKQLSADRQRRALSDRVHDLEAQIAKLEAEREQFDLENRSLVNRLKVANVVQEDVEQAKAEVARLQEQILQMRANPSEANAQEINALQTQIADMTEGIESLKEQNRASAEMLEDMRHRLAAANKAVEEREALLENANKTIAERDAELVQLKELLAEYDEVTAKLEQIDKVMTDNEKKIKKQKSTIAARDAEIEELRKTISDNLRMQAEREKELQDQIDALKGVPEDTPKQIVAPMGGEVDKTPQISEDDLSEIEQAFESGDWFTSIPPASTPSMRPDEAASDFGYREPQRKTPPPSNGQLSLFDSLD